MCDIDFDLALTLDVNSTVIREEMKDLAFQAYQRNEIEFGQMLDVADFGDTAKLKQAWEDYKVQKQAMAQVQTQQAAAGQPVTPVTSGNPSNGAQHLISTDADGSHTLAGTPSISS